LLKNVVFLSVKRGLKRDGAHQREELGALQARRLDPGSATGRRRPGRTPDDHWPGPTVDQVPAIGLVGCVIEAAGSR